jgi:hypothetical protein
LYNQGIRFNFAKGFTYDTYACTVLDTTPPTTPTFYITGISNTNVITKTVRLSSLVATKPNTQLTIKVSKGGVNVGTYYVMTDGVGNWTFAAPSSLFVPGLYDVATSLSDLAGNVSQTAHLSVTIARACTGPNCGDVPPACPIGTSGPTCTPDKPKPACPAGTSGPNCTPNNDGPIGGDPVGGGPNGDGGTGGNGPDGAGGGAPTGAGGAGGTDGAGSSGGAGNGGSGAGTAGDSSGGSTAGSGSGGVGGSNETGVEITIPTNLATVKPVAETRSPVVVAVEKTVDRAVEFVSDPQVQTVNQVAVAPTLVTAAVANALTGVGAASMLNFLHFVFAQPILALRRRNAKSWGVVYNAYSKLPVDLASVRLIETASGRVLQSQVTDLQGRYFMATPDATKSYRLEVSKAGYKGIAQLRQTDDAPFLNLYHGTEFTAAAEHPEIAYSIPLEPDAGNLSALQIIRQKNQTNLASCGQQLRFSV